NYCVRDPAVAAHIDAGASQGPLQLLARLADELYVLLILVLPRCFPDQEYPPLALSGRLHVRVLAPLVETALLALGDYGKVLLGDRAKIFKECHCHPFSWHGN